VHYVLDACAMIAFLRRESGAEMVEQLLRAPRNVCMAHAINLCEVHYQFIRSDGEATADGAIATLLDLGLMTIEMLDDSLWRDASHLKAANRLSLADAVGLALARSLNATFVTSDHHELDALADAGVCRIRFIR
jgi:predicted nucleic acid-binding protein